jgi:ubiquinone biosynthesis monooxygenase Coq7
MTASNNCLIHCANDCSLSRFYCTIEVNETMASTVLCTRSLARRIPRTLPHPVHDFLAPGTACASRFQSTSASTQTTHQPPPPPDARTPISPASPLVSHDASSKEKKPIRPLSQEQRDFLSSALRVNQTGELAAILIYAAQNPILVRSHPHLRPLMKHMYDQEAGHYKYFNEVISKHRIRPTAMTPVWTAAASMLGWSTAVLGREAAMACTEAVETEIGTHYNEQVRVLLDWAKKCEDRGESLGPELDKLVVELRRIRDEELEHLDHAVENDAKQAKPYELLTEVIRGGCRGAIWVSERV